MLKNLRQTGNLQILYEPGSNENSTPERLLLIAVLERAFRDLFSDVSTTRKHAILWFQDTDLEFTADDRFTFTQVIDTLELSVPILDIIRVQVAKAEHYKALINERKAILDNKMYRDL